MPYLTEEFLDTLPVALERFRKDLGFLESNFGELKLLQQRMKDEVGYLVHLFRNNLIPQPTQRLSVIKYLNSIAEIINRIQPETSVRAKDVQTFNKMFADDHKFLMSVVAEMGRVKSQDEITVRSLALLHHAASILLEFSDRLEAHRALWEPWFEMVSHQISLSRTFVDYIWTQLPQYASENTATA